MLLWSNYTVRLLPINCWILDCFLFLKFWPSYSMLSNFYLSNTQYKSNPCNKSFEPPKFFKRNFIFQVHFLLAWINVPLFYHSKCLQIWFLNILLPIVSIFAEMFTKIILKAFRVITLVNNPI